MSLIIRLVLISFALIFSCPILAQPEKLIFAIDLIRHGDRTPAKDLPQAPYDWPQGLGQLTPKGMQQEYMLGLIMRKRYVDENGLLPPSYNAETIRVRSSDYDRTLMSAESLLMGLYPLGTGPLLPQSEQTALPAGFQPIPIHTLPRDQDQLLVPDHDPKQFEEWAKKYVADNEWREKTAELQPQFARFSELSGMQITRLEHLIYLGDAIYIRQLYHLPLPQGMTEQEADTIMEAGRWAFTQIFKAPAMGQLTGQPLLQEIIANLKKASQGQTKLKWMLFSGHDSTILSLMSAMQVPMETPPPYASNLNFALYETESGRKIVKVTLNGKNAQLPVCEGKVCTLSQFETLSKQVRTERP